MKETALEFDLSEPLSYVFTGKFKAPDPSWIHLSRILLDYELVAITDGILYINNNGINYTVQKGEYLIMPPDTPQSGWKNSDCSFYWLHFKESTNSGKRKISVPQKGTIDNFEKIIVMMKQLQDCVRSYNDQTENDYITTSIICELSNQSREKTKATGEEVQKQIYNDILDYVKRFIHQNIKVSEIAEHFGYNEKYVSFLFKKHSGQPLKQYILFAKMETAKFILSDTNKNIGEISAQLGFSDSHNFMKAFKKVTGLTPSEYRNAYAKRMLFYE